jgi:hypothetical protein
VAGGSCATRLPAKYADAAPRIVRMPDGNDTWLYEGRESGNFALKSFSPFCLARRHAHGSLATRPNQARGRANPGARRAVCLRPTTPAYGLPLRWRV